MENVMKESQHVIVLFKCDVYKDFWLQKERVTFGRSYSDEEFEDDDDIKKLYARPAKTQVRYLAPKVLKKVSHAWFKCTIYVAKNFNKSNFDEFINI